MQSPEVAKNLKGRLAVQLSTGTPQEARDAQSWFNEQGAGYLDGVIQPYPDGIGEESAQLLFSGSEQVFKAALPYLECFGGDIRYVGNKVGAAAALDLAGLASSLGLYTGFAHGARLCEVEGVGLDQFASLQPAGDRLRELAEIIHSESFELGSLHDGASIRVWHECIQRLQAQAQNAGMSAEFPDNISAIFNRALAAGIGEEDLAALIKVLRS